MRLVLLLATFIFSQYAFGVSVSNSWTDSFEKKVKLECSAEESECRNFCGRENDCTYTEKICRNCLGSSLKLSYIFTEMGRAYKNSGVEFRWDHVYDLLRSKKYVTLTSKSIYNQVTRFNAMSIRRRFRALCDEARNPMAFFRTEANGEIGEPAFVACDNKVFELVHDTTAILHSDDLF